MLRSTYEALIASRNRNSVHVFHRRTYHKANIEHANFLPNFENLEIAKIAYVYGEDCTFLKEFELEKRCL